MVLIALLLAVSVSASTIPPVQEGDLVFHHSTSRQSALVAEATGSEWTHMGVVLMKDGAPVVLEAVEPVRETPLADWIAAGASGVVVVKRLKDAPPAAAMAKLHALGESWLGRHYDARFEWSDDRLYCSELVWKLYDRAAGVDIGALQKAGTLRLGAPKIQAEIRRRFPGATFDPDELVITPQSMFDDPKLVTVFSNE